MAAAFGVHLGSTSACLAVHKDGHTDVIANDAGDRTTPAVVAFTDHEQVVGLAAKQGIIRNASNTVCKAKQVIGLKYDNHCVQQYISSSRVEVIEKDGQPAYKVEYMEKTIQQTPTQIVGTIYKKMMETAQSHGGQGIHDAVITVPTDFGPEQRDAMNNAAESAGFNVLRIISEPAAAALAYDIGQSDTKETCNVMVFRVGGSTMEVAIMTVNNGMYRILADVQKPLGGGAFTEAIVGQLVSEFKRQSRLDVTENKRGMAKLRNAAENCKHVLSKLGSAPCHIESLHEGVDFQSSIARGRFEMLAGNLLQDYNLPIQEALDQAGLEKNDVHKVIMCGGTSNIPCVYKKVQSILPQAELLNSISPEEVIAVGAAKEAAILTGSEEESTDSDCLLECLPCNLQIKCKGEGGDDFKTIFSEKTPIPVRHQEQYTLAAEQTSFCLELYQHVQGNDTRTLLGKVVLRDLAGGGDVNVVYHVKREGSVHVTCNDKVSGQCDSIAIEPESE